MPRPSRNTDRMLIQEGRKLLPKTGSSGLNLREVASKAGVNLGMFHYHFKTKDEFIRRVLEEIYGEFFKDFSMEVGEDGTAMERLRRSLSALGRFSRDNRTLIVSLLRDVLNGDKEVVRFVRENFGRHFGVLVSLIRESQKEGALEKEVFPLVVVQLALSVGAPNLVFELLERVTARRAFGLALSVLRGTVLSDSAIDKRVDRALKGWAV